jgi:Glycosyl hydrolases family 2, sugar binding domain
VATNKPGTGRVNHTRRDALSLDGSWDFIRDPERRFTPGRLSRGEPIVVPGPWEAQLAKPYGIVHAWYRRRFAVPDDWSDATLLLRFGAAMARATVWLDGRQVGEHDEGYLPFEIEAGPARSGAERELVVEIENPLNVLSEYPAFGAEARRAAVDRLDGQSFDGLSHGKQAWYTSTSGLLGSVAAELAPDPRFAALMVLPDLDARLALVRWRVAGVHAGEPATVDLTVTSPAGRVVAEASTDARARGATLAIPDPEQWDLWRPELYRLDARLHHDGRGNGRGGDARTDGSSVRFGMRSIAVRDGAILLNGRPVYIRGALDQDLWPIGRSNPPSRPALDAQVALAREMGLNLLRCHIKIPDPAYLDAADEAGLLLWCELPSWVRFDRDAGRIGRRMLGEMVETMGSHPSIVAWTVINEDWGTDLRHEARDRRWLRTTVDQLRAIDPSRLVVDNSACEASDGPNFHIRTDLADYHAYRSMPDGLPRWRALIADFARRPDWLWSPHGDATRSGDEALVLSEFGSWGLPRPSAVLAADGREPWWWETGQAFCRPAGIHRRFQRQRLDRIWPDVDSLSEATQWRQFDALAAQVGELRRHASIKGYVVTELADAFWEANGLLDVGRGPKVYHDRLGEINGPDVLIVDVPRTDLWGGERVVCDVALSSYPDGVEDAVEGGRLDWRISAPDGVSNGGSLSLECWPVSDARVIARLEIDVPGVPVVTIGELLVTAVSGRGGTRAVYRRHVVIVPASMRRSARPGRVGIVDELDLWAIASRLEGLGHALVERDLADIVVAADVDRDLVGEIERGRTLLLLARSTGAIPAGLGLARPIVVRPRRPGEATDASERPWDGDWCSVFAWALPGAVPGLPDGGLLGDAHGEIFPDHVLDGLDVAAPLDGVEVGLFSGWVHSPVALLAQFDQGSGQVIATTLQLAPEDGPVATALLEQLVQRALDAAARRITTKAGSVAR